MRFLLVCTTFPPAFVYGGPPRANLGLAQGLKRLGHEVLVITTDANGDKSLDVPKNVMTEVEGVPVIYLSCWHPKSYFFTPRLASEIAARRGQWDIGLLRGQWTYFNLLGSRLLSAMRMPYVVYPEGCLEPWALHHKGWKKVLYWRLVEKQVYAHAAGVVSLTRREAEQVEAATHHRNVAIIPNGVSVEALRNASSDSIVLPHGLANKRLILFMSRIHRGKGLDLLVQAFGRISEEHPNYILGIAGPSVDAEYDRKVRNFIMSFGLQERVVFIGPVYGQQRFALLRAADVFVLTSHSEGLPMAVLEAGACGVPVLITRACNLPEFEQAGAGIFVEASVDSVTDGLRRMLADEGERRKMGARANELVSTRFTWDRVAEQTAAFCSSLLDSRAL